MRPCQTILASFNSHQSDASLVAKENRQELLQAIFGQLARIPCKTVGVQALVEVLHSSYHVNLDSGGRNVEGRHRGSSTGATSRFPERSQQRYLRQLNPL
eukprot:scpid107613/ scgid30986/ 